MFTDECTVQLEHHSHIYFRKKLQPCVLKQRAKHPMKIHIWEGISARGALSIVMFTNIMNACHLAVILKLVSLPFIEERFSDGDRLY